MNIIAITHMADIHIATHMHTETVMTGLPDLRLMQLVSPSLPIGSFTYSQGMEWAVEAGMIKNSGDVFDWLTGLIRDSLTWLDLPVLQRLYHAVENDDVTDAGYWSEYLLASRETRELRQEEINRGRALARLLVDLDVEQANRFEPAMQITQLAGFALAAVSWRIPFQQVALGYSWGWIENQVAAAIKLVPLGQTDGQKLQLKLTELIPSAVEEAVRVTDDDIGASAPVMAIASSLHETQYTRLFRS